MYEYFCYHVVIGNNFQLVDDSKILTIILSLILSRFHLLATNRTKLCSFCFFINLLIFVLKALEIHGGLRAGWLKMVMLNLYGVRYFQE